MRGIPPAVPITGLNRPRGVNPTGSAGEFAGPPRMGIPDGSNDIAQVEMRSLVPNKDLAATRRFGARFVCGLASRSPGQTAPALGPEKRSQDAQRRRGTQSGDLLGRVACRGALRVNHAVGLANRGGLLARDTGSSKSHAVEPGDVPLEGHDGVGRNIPTHTGVSRDHGQGTDANELMNHGRAAEGHAVSNLDMPGQQHVVDQGDAAPQHAVVSDVSAAEQEAILADNRLGLRLGSTMHGHVLSQDRTATNATKASTPLETNVLRFVPDDHAGMKYAILFDRRPAGQVNVWIETTAGRDADVSLDHAERSDLDAGVDFGFGINDGRWVNRHDAIQFDAPAGCAGGERPSRFITICKSAHALPFSPGLRSR